MTLKAKINGVWTKIPIYAVIDAIHTRFSSEKYEAENVSDALEEVADDVTELKSNIIKKLDANQGEENEGKILGIDENGDVIPTNAPSPLPTPSSALNGKVLKVKDGQWDVGEDDIGLSDDDKMFSFAIDEDSHLILSTTDATMQNYDFEIDSNGHLIMTYEEA